MDLAFFRALDKAAKVDYVISRLQFARTLFRAIYNNCEKGLSQDILIEMESLGDDFCRYGIMTEDGMFEEVFHGLEKSLERLQKIADLAARGPVV